MEPPVSQLCTEGQHEAGELILSTKCRGWCWHLPGQEIGPECTCPCHALHSATMRADGLARVLKESSV